MRKQVKIISCSGTHIRARSASPLICLILELESAIRRISRDAVDQPKLLNVIGTLARRVPADDERCHQCPLDSDEDTHIDDDRVPGVRTGGKALCWLSFISEG